MEYTKQGRRNRTLIIIWTIFVIAFIYLPVICDALSSVKDALDCPKNSFLNCQLF